MKSVLLLISSIAVFSVSAYVAPSGGIALLMTAAFALAFGRWLGVWSRKGRGAVFGDNDFAVSALDTDASPTGRALARLRDDL